jgi:hypothetical protein
VIVTRAINALVVVGDPLGYALERVHRLQDVGTDARIGLYATNQREYPLQHDGHEGAAAKQDETHGEFGEVLEEDDRIGQREADGKDEGDVAKLGYALAGEDVVLVAYESRDADDVEHHEDEASQDHPLRYRPKQCGAPPQRLPSNDTSASGDGRLGPLRWEALPAR